MDASLEKVRLEIALARAYYAMLHAEKGDALATHALSTGSAIFQKELLADPGKLTYLIKGFTELLDATGLLGSKSTKPWDALHEIGQFQPEVMRPRLIVAFAQGLEKRSAASASPAPSK